jgi:hypothetical protein
MGFDFAGLTIARLPFNLMATSAVVCHYFLNELLQISFDCIIFNIDILPVPVFD